ncbi:MAG TPA: hypothetical protein PLL07_11315 [Nitrosomonas sp.]|nr:hypothetical protein [Nitrosomonas sp.]
MKYFFLFISTAFVYAQTDSVFVRAGIGYSLHAQNANFNNQNVIRSINSMYGRAKKNDVSMWCDNFSIRWITNDPYNSDKFNISIISLVRLISMSKAKHNDMNWDKSLNYLLPLNGRFYFWGAPKNPVALVLKNDTDWFFIRKKQWISVSPGIGLGIGPFASGIEYDFWTNAYSSTAKKRYFLTMLFMGN